MAVLSTQTTIANIRDKNKTNKNERHDAETTEMRIDSERMLIVSYKRMNERFACS